MYICFPDVKARREREDNYLTRIAELEHQNGELQGEISQLQIGEQQSIDMPEFFFVLFKALALNSCCFHYTDLAAANVLNGNGGDVDLPLTIKIQERGLYDIGVQV